MKAVTKVGDQCSSEARERPVEAAWCCCANNNHHLPSLVFVSSLCLLRTEVIRSVSKSFSLSDGKMGR